MSEMSKQTYVRQGDLLFVPLDLDKAEHIVADAMSERCRKTSGVLAEGEATGHHHRIATEDLEKVEVYETWRGTYLRVTGDKISIVHEEHGPVELERGEYEMHRAREWDYRQGLGRQVVD
jgi:hypothetical protein